MIESFSYRFLVYETSYYYDINDFTPQKTIFHVNLAKSYSAFLD